MANDKTYDRHINIWINGKEVKNDISTIKKEMYALTNELSRTTRGTKEYYEKAAELKKLKVILKEHQDQISATGTAWTKVKDLFKGAMGVIGAGAAAIFGAYKSIKGVVESTEGISDRFEKIMAGGKEVFWEFQRSIATLDFSNLLTNLRDAWERGKKLNEELDRLSDERAYSDYIISSLSRESRELQEVIKNVQLDISVRSDAAEKRKEIEEKIYARSVKIASKTFKTEKDSWDDRNKMASEEAIKLYESIDKWGPEVEKRMQDAYERAKSDRGPRATDEEITERMTHITDFSRASIEAFVTFTSLIEEGETDVLIKLFSAYKNFENATADAQERLNLVVKESSQIFKKEGNASDNLEESFTGLFKDLFENPAFDPDNSEYVKKSEAAIDKLIADETAAYDKLEQDNKETRERMAEVAMEQADEALKNAENNANTEVLTFEQKERRKQELAAITSDTINSIQNILSSSFEKSKQRELRAAGNNAKEREKIEKEYAKKEQDLAITMAIINGALAISMA